MELQPRQLGIFYTPLRRVKERIEAVFGNDKTGSDYKFVPPCFDALSLAYEGESKVRSHDFGHKHSGNVGIHDGHGLNEPGDDMRFVRHGVPSTQHPPFRAGSDSFSGRAIHDYDTSNFTLPSVENREPVSVWLCLNNHWHCLTGLPKWEGGEVGP